MSATRTLPRDRRDQLLLNAIREQRRVLLTHHGVDGWQLYKGRFYNPKGASDGLFVQVPTVSREGRTVTIKVGEALGCAFRDGHRKCLCTAVVEILRRDGDAVTLRLSRPEQIQQMQRRSFERAAPSANTVIAVRFWLDETGAPHTRAEREVRHGQLIDISAGGMRVKIPNPHDIDMDVTYRCVFTTGPGKPAFVLDALLRHRETEERGRAALGFQFVGLETTAEGRHTLDRLARLVSHFQRHRHRRSKSTA